MATTERPPEVISEREQYPEIGQTGRPYVPTKHLPTDYPVRNDHLGPKT